MKKILGLFVGLILVLTLAVSVHAAGGFDEFGYNNTARIFNGPLSGWCNKLYSNTNGCVGSPYETWANDHLAMKWNAEWDRGNAEGWTGSNGYNAWIDNEWNGMVPGGSGETWHYKIAWDKGCASVAHEPSTEAIKGGAYCLWGPFALLQSQGSGADRVHVWEVLLKPAGYGAY